MRQDRERVEPHGRRVCVWLTGPMMDDKLQPLLAYVARCQPTPTRALLVTLDFSEQPTTEGTEQLARVP